MYSCEYRSMYLFDVLFVNLICSLFHLMLCIRTFTLRHKDENIMCAAVLRFLTIQRLSGRESVYQKDRALYIVS